MNMRLRPSRRWLALAFLLAETGLAASAAPAPQLQTLTLTNAVEQALQQNPYLQVFPLRLQAAEGQRDSAALAPPVELALEAENLAGSGEFSGTERAEYTLSIGSVIELGGKRGARTHLADSRYGLAALEREAAAIDLVAQVTQRFVSVLSLQAQLAVEQQARQLAQETEATVASLSASGAVPEADALRAKASAARASLDLAALQADLAAARLALATLWGSENVNFAAANGDLYTLTPAPDFDALWRRAAAAPALTRFASQQRIAAAELALARSQASANVQWRLGVRRDQVSGDAALMASVAVPLFTDQRNSGAVKAAHAEQAQLAHQQRRAALDLRAQLFAAWQRYRHSRAAATTLQAEIIPALAAAQRQTRRAYEQGRYRYSEWLAVQRELIDARHQLIANATTALHNQALIEQLTAMPLSQEAGRDD